MSGRRCYFCRPRLSVEVSQTGWFRNGGWSASGLLQVQEAQTTPCRVLTLKKVSAQRSSWDARHSFRRVLLEVEVRKGAEGDALVVDNLS